ncbi:sugar ABC transporter ATP-binding protein [Pseudoruegeria sp. SK021]|uniref:sugar ABC transporter ATP-binding protein n=1 Tax=Pseudoruegeria sp. SK021 TaxID=1933035 RepID=UPI000A230486|nr:sugar ABC transporter ATP-binding protein [Pseudoruegeria sp. SK021]OSP53447.1 D-xylose ABC transporter ATP-binding protein [Pseudoruegeria sp. SK021]
MTALLELNGLSKSYPGVKALLPFDLSFRRGEVHALLGENGAGKSTLIKTITGAVTTDSGAIRLDGLELTGHDPAMSLDRGIAAIYQEFSLFPELTVAENVFYGRELRGPGGFLRRRRMEDETANVLRDLGTDISPRAKVANLSVGHQQLVELAKSVSRDAKVLIMDEPTAPLTNKEVEFLYAVVGKLKARGVTIIYISHRLKEIFDLCDRVTVMRDGALISTLEIASTSEAELVTLMVGRPVDQEFPPSTARIGEVVLEAQNLVAPKVNDVSLHVRAGEILGLAGLVGAGRTETARLIFGADTLISGQIRLDGQNVTVRTPRDAIAHGIGLIPEDRKHHGVLLGMSVTFNTVYAALKQVSPGLFANAMAERAAGEKYRDQLRIKTPNLEQLVVNLSGGNQQKVVLAKWLLTGSRVLIFDEPTRGIDVGAKQEIYGLMRELSNAGVAIVMISSEMPELLGMSDRVIVLCEGRVAGELGKADFDQEKVLRLASGLGNEGKTDEHE